MGWMTKGMQVAWIRAMVVTVLVLGPVQAMASGQSVPFVGVALADTDLHAAAFTSYVTGRLKKGELVRVEQVIQGWYKIEPPAGSYSLISKMFLTPQGDGSIGKVHHIRAVAKAPNLEVKGNSYRTQVSLVKGAKVNIIGRYGGYYMIATPEGAYVYVPGAAIRRATREEIRHGALAKVPTPTGPQAKSQPSTAADVNLTGHARESSGPALASGLGATSPPPASERSPSLDEAPAPVTPEVAKLASSPLDADTLPSVDGSNEASAAESGRGILPGQLPALENLSPTATEPADAPVALAPSGPGLPEPGSGGPNPDLDHPEPDAAAAAVTPADAVVDSPAEPLPSSVPQGLAQIERRFERASKLPLERQPVAMLLEHYRALKAGPGVSDADHDIIQSRITTLKRRALLGDTLKQIVQARQRRTESARVQPGGSASDPAPPVPWPVVQAQSSEGRSIGRLVASRVFDGKRLPRLLRLVDPATGRALGYVRPGAGIDPTRHLGKIVTFSSNPRWDADLKVRLLEPSGLPMVLAMP